MKVVGILVLLAPSKCKRSSRTVSRNLSSAVVISFPFFDMAICISVRNAVRGDSAIGIVSLLAVCLPRWIGHAYNLWQNEEAGPNHLKMLLVSIQNVAQVYSPDNVTICANAGHEMPPAVALQNESPRHSNVSSPCSECRTVDVVEIPDVESTEEDADAERHQDPHSLENFLVSLVLVCLFFFAYHVWYTSLLSFDAMLLLRFSQGWAQGGLHAVNAAEDDEDGENGVDDLVEHGVL